MVENLPSESLGNKGKRKKTKNRKTFFKKLGRKMFICICVCHYKISACNISNRAPCCETQNNEVLVIRWKFGLHTSYTFRRSWRRCCGTNSFTRKGLNQKHDTFNIEQHFTWMWTENDSSLSGGVSRSIDNSGLNIKGKLGGTHKYGILQCNENEQKQGICSI